MPTSSGILVCASHVGGKRAVDALLRSGYEVSAAVCPSAAQARDWGISGYFDYREVFHQAGIDVYTPTSYSLTADSDVGFFAERRFSALVQGGWQRLFPGHVLEALDRGAVGLHGSSDLLPKGRGRSPMNWTLIEGRKRFLLHLFLIGAGADSGDVIDVKDFDVNEFDDIGTLYLKYSIVYRDLLMANLPAILDGTARLRPQQGIPTHYSKRTPEMGVVDWEVMDVWEVHNFVRAQTRPYPGVVAEIEGQQVRIWRAAPFDTRIRYDLAEYGSVVERDHLGLVVNCRGGLLLIQDWEACP